MSKQYTFSIADFRLSVIFQESHSNIMGLLPCFRPFQMAERQTKTDVSMTVCSRIEAIDRAHYEPIGCFNTTFGTTQVDQLLASGYQFVLCDAHNRVCCLMRTNRTFTDCQCRLNGNEAMQQLGLNHALMLAFAFYSSQHAALLLHASTVRCNGLAYPFIAKSGTGKTTHTQLWLKHILHCDLLNDDNPALRLINGNIYLYGTPWSGLTPCYRQMKAPLGAVTLIARASSNSIERLPPVAAFAALLSSCATMKWDEMVYDSVCSTIGKVVEKADFYKLKCLPNKEAALLCHQTITR